ncbi:hypothetical protein [Rhizomonospora bruguierae]|uniref:hypothetical protein n=1 Tax=Rhizomonospora bruguierae TaxID=1581705 RepID=UPI001BCFDDC4|nr:hypothetical protein [Micromonospora sp. NBRC 107566]
MAQWAVVLPAERVEAERLFHHDRVEVSGRGGEPPAPGDEVVFLTENVALAASAVEGGVVAPGALAAVALGRVTPDGSVAYTRRAFDAPQPAGGLALTGPLTRLDPADFRDLAGRLAPPGARRAFLVSVDLPIEAETPAEAVGRFWSYVMELGPRELPAFVWPSGQELAMQAYVLGVEANQDPEEDD